FGPTGCVERLARSRCAAMRVLFVVPFLPYPADRGDRLTCLNVLREMTRRHRVTLLCPVDGREAPGALERVAACCERVEAVPFSRAGAWLRAWAALASTTPSQVEYFADPGLRARAREMVGATPFDAILYYTMRLATVAEAVDHPRQVMWVVDSIGLR